MSDFTSMTCCDSTLDPLKRVNYVTGLVLGADEFCQEQAYLLNRDRVHQWATHGYGAVLGLEVRATNNSGKPTVVVEPGRAVDPCGRPICVPSSQCADLNAWLASHSDDVIAASGSPPGPIAVYVTLCYRECETDQVPLPSGPCASTDDSMAASRIADSFLLSLTLERPLQVEENATRLLGDLLRRIRVADDSIPNISKQEIFEYVKTIPAAVWEGSAACGSPPVPSIPIESLPIDSIPFDLVLAPDDAVGFARELIDFWVREVRPHLFCKCGCGKPLPDDPCLLLAELRFEIDDSGASPVVSDPDAIEVDQSRRASLLTTRMLQEWLAGGIEAIMIGSSADGGEPSGPAGGDLSGTYPDPTVDAIQNNPVSPAAPAVDNVLVWNGSEWTPDSISTGPSGPASGDLSGNYPAPTVVGLQANPVSSAAPNADDVLTWTGTQWAPSAVTSAPSGPAGGDLSGTYPNPTVGGLQSSPVSATAPTTLGHVLTWTGAEWSPGTGASPPNDGQVLTWVAAANEWRPANVPDPTVEGFVEAPSGSYAIVAAGMFTVVGVTSITPAATLYGDLRAGTSRPFIVLGGSWYDPGRFQYIAKFTFFRREPFSSPIDVSSLEMRPDGVFFTVADARGQVQGEFQMMVEISAYPL